MKHVGLFFLGIALLAAPTLCAADDLADRLAAADAASGEKVFKKCKGCHTVEKGGKNKTGPNLWGVVGREVAGLESFTRYSKSLKEFGGTWSFDRLDLLLAKPKPKSLKHPFAGLKKEEDRADLLVFLDSMGESPSLPGKGVSSD